MKSLKKTVLYLILAIVSQCETTTTTSVAPTTTTATTTSTSTNSTTTTTSEPIGSSNDAYNLFAADLFTVIANEKSSQNIVYSPVAIQTCLALTFMGAEGETAEEMRKVLRLSDDNKIQIASAFGKFSNIPLSKTNNPTDEVPQLKIINRLYVNQQLEVSQEFNKIALEYFDTQAEQVNFNDSKKVAEKVNNWVAEQTEDKIKNLLHEDAVNIDTSVILVNAIYFKAKWLNAFSQSSTLISNFYITQNDIQQAEIMYNEEFYGYAVLPELQATALEMPFNNSDISMLIILPNEIEGLQSLEMQLKNKDLNEIINKMLIKKVHAYVPKFTIEFNIDLKEPLEKMGLVTTFTLKANFKSLFTTPDLQSISEVKHKAFLDVNEAGSEAAAATFVTITTLSGIFDEPIFRADHPFIFAILSKSAVYFAGHVYNI